MWSAQYRFVFSKYLFEPPTDLTHGGVCPNCVKDGWHEIVVRASRPLHGVQRGAYLLFATTLLHDVDGFDLFLLSVFRHDEDRRLRLLLAPEPVHAHDHTGSGFDGLSVLIGRLFDLTLDVALFNGLHHS